VGFWRRKAEERSLTYTVQPWVPAESSATPTAALANPDVYSCSRVLADAAASCPLIVYRRLPSGERRRASNRTADLLRAPAEGTTQASFVSTLLSHLLLWGNGYLGKYRDQDGRVEQLLPIRPDRVVVERRRGRIVFTVTDEAGHMSEHGLDDVVHVKALSTDGLVGLSPIRQMRAALEANVAVRAASTALFRNNARPSGILTINGHANENTVRMVKDAWTARHSGSEQGGIAVVSGDLSFTAVAMPADDAEFIAARKLSATEVARCFRCPPWMIGAEDGGSMTYSNVEQQMLSFVVFSLQPWLRVIEQALTADRDLFTSTTFCEFLLDGLLRADSKTRAEVYEKALDPITGWLRRDEVRRLENLEPEAPETLAALGRPKTTNGAVAA
jgi:HK97 family phage portal protein